MRASKRAAGAKAGLTALVVALSLTAPAARAQEGEPFEGRGYAVGCDAEGDPLACYIVAGGFTLSVMQDGGTPAALFGMLQALPAVSAVDLSGALSDFGDSSANLVLDSLSPAADDPWQATLRAMQGTWRPEGATAGVLVEIAGLDWYDRDGDDLISAQAISPATGCAAEGAAADAGGLAVLSLYRFGDDPGVDACWRIDSLSADEIELTGIGPTTGSLRLRRGE